jgi:hypothetical protein
MHYLVSKSRNLGLAQLQHTPVTRSLGLDLPFDVIFDRRKLPIPKFLHNRPPAAHGRTRTRARVAQGIDAHRVAGQSERGLEVFPRGLRPPAGKLKLTKRRRVEGIGGETVAVANGADFCKPALRAIPLGYGDGSVQLNDRGGIDRDQFVVE